MWYVITCYSLSSSCVFSTVWQISRLGHLYKISKMWCCTKWSVHECVCVLPVAEWQKNKLLILSVRLLVFDCMFSHWLQSLYFFVWSWLWKRGNFFVVIFQLMLICQNESKVDKKFSPCFDMYFCWMSSKVCWGIQSLVHHLDGKVQKHTNTRVYIDVNQILLFIVNFFGLELFFTLNQDKEKFLDQIWFCLPSRLNSKVTYAHTNSPKTWKWFIF